MKSQARDSLRRCFEDCKSLVREKNCAPIMVRLAWHECGNYDRYEGDGGSVGSIRFEKELDHAANAGLGSALELLAPLKERYADVSHADLIQMASAASIEVSGGPKIPMRYGRVDAASDEAVPPEGRLPDGEAPFHQADGPCPGEVSEDASAAAHLRRVFSRMGFDDRDVVALSGAHTIGRAYKERSGLPSKDATKYTDQGPGRPGGMSWTKSWLTFDNSYFKVLVDASQGKEDEDLFRMSTDAVLLEDEGFSPHCHEFARDQEAFFVAYAAAHAKLSELGAHFVPPEGIRL
ncbi:ascorbate peroxidase [Chloropicon primus]|uniref:L-ascorbate peroxidase n=1 Tax=Chloropicon primus TaxID=1764295 RepID=A0A5B8MI17_9CHLO|nr:ascorbate peroxidase [Chloropicon primus]UPQ98218.1 ascorbate peroxidase [Chloropicon primus]|eukprot:QDZ19010.1 ascorbate peroxidase [Chloropicon primus]